MGHLTDRERIINLEQGLDSLTTLVEQIVAKLPEYDKIIDLNKSYKERLKKARASKKKLQEKVGRTGKKS